MSARWGADGRAARLGSDGLVRLGSAPEGGVPTCAGITAAPTL
ncbi:hypothetical protein WME79_01360 [Sorangium sp. So ce726]